MREVRHQRQRLARGADLLEQPERVVGVRIGHEPLRPVGQRLGPDPDRLEVVQPRVEQRLDVLPEHPRAHDHRVAAGDQDAGDLAMRPQVGGHPGHVVRGHLQVWLTDELRPAEAVGAVRVAGLPLFREDQDSLRILVLNARKRLVGHGRDVQRELARRVRIQSHPHRPRRGLYVAVGCAAREQARYGPDVLRGQHVGLREDQPVDRIIGSGVPVDQTLHDVLVCPERKYRRDRPDGQPVRLGEAGSGDAAGLDAWRYMPGIHAPEQG